MLRHRHLTSYILGIVEFLGADEDEAQLVSVPPYHVAGVSAVLSSLYSGRRIVYLPGFDPEEWVRPRSSEGVTQAMVVPTMLGRVLDAAARPRAATWRRCATCPTAAGACRVELIERAMAAAARRRLRQRLRPHRDQLDDRGARRPTTTGTACASDDPAVRARLGSVGRPLPSIELEIRDADGDVLPRRRAGRDLRAGRAGGRRVPRPQRPHRRRLVPDQRRRLPRRGRLPLPRRPARRRDRAGRARTCRRARSRTSLRRPPGGGRGRGGRHPRRRVGRGGRRRRRARAGRGGHGRRAPGVGARAAALDEDAAADPVPRRAALQRDRQAAAPRAAEELAGGPALPA